LFSRWFCPADLLAFTARCELARGGVAVHLPEKCEDKILAGPDKIRTKDILVITDDGNGK